MSLPALGPCPAFRWFSWPTRVYHNVLAFRLFSHLDYHSENLVCIQELLEVETGRVELLRLEDRWGRTPLLLATSNGNTEVEQNFQKLGLGDSTNQYNTGSKPPLGEGRFNQGLQQRQRNPASFLRPVLINFTFLYINSAK